MGSPASSVRLPLSSLFQLLASSDIKSEEFVGLYNVCRSLRHPSLVMLSLMLRGFIMLSKKDLRW